MKIIFGMDGSSESIAAGKLLARLPFADAPELIVVTALLDSSHELVPVDVGEQMRANEEQVAHQSFADLSQLLAPCCSRIEHVIAREHPHHLLMRVAEEQSADLIVLGARGHSAAYRVLLGSTADYITNHAKCSVLIVRDQPAAETNPEFRLFLAYDGTPASQDAYHQLRQLQWPTERTELHIAMLLARPSLVPDDVIYDPDLVKESTSVVSSLEQFDFPVRHTIRESMHVGSTLRHLVEENQSNLLFLGGTGRSPLARFFLGSASRYLLHHTTCSLWIARQSQWV